MLLSILLGYSAERTDFGEGGKKDWEKACLRHSIVEMY